MGVYQSIEEKNGKALTAAENRKAGRGGGKVDDREVQLSKGKAACGGRASKKAIDMTIRPKWEQIEKVRRKARSFLKNQGLSKDVIDALTMVSSELVENGLKYGFYEGPETRLNVNLYIQEGQVIVEVTHPTGAGATSHLRRLDKTLQWIRGFQDPFQAYLEKLKEVARKPIHDSESGLGLVRIAYEGKAIIDFFVGEENAVNVSATAGIDKGLWR